MADMVKRFNTPDCESGMHEFEPRYPPQYEINGLAVRPNFFCLKVILSLLLTFFFFFGKIAFVRRNEYGTYRGQIY